MMQRTVLIGFVVMILLAGCGVKTALTPPDVLVAKTITNLQGTVKENSLVLTWGVPQINRDGSRPADVVRFSVLRRDEPKGCIECPGEFKVRAELDLRTPTPQGYVREDNTITWQDKDLKEEVTYIYRIVSVNHWGYQSAPSNDFVIKWGPPPPPPEFAAPADTQQKQGQ
jgi:hypothetical protein